MLVILLFIPGDLVLCFIGFAIGESLARQLRGWRSLRKLPIRRRLDEDRFGIKEDDARNPGGL